MEDWTLYKRGGKDMKRSIEFKYIDEKFVLSEHEQVLFEIDSVTLKFDSLRFYNGVYKEKSSAINLINETEQKVKNSAYVFDWLNDLIENISRELSDDEPVDEEMLDDVIPTDDVNVEASAYENRIIPLYDLAVCAGNGDFIDESMGFQDFQTENGEADYALIISGESMEPTIPNGSIVLVKKVSELTNNDIAIVSTGGETMCKRYIKRGKGVFLKPDNPNPEYKEFNKKDCLTFLIRGKVVDIIKP